MSKLNLTRRTFLEKEELARFQQFLADSPSENAIIGNTSKWGILRTDFATDTDFLVEPSANAGRVKIDKTVNKALTSAGLRAVQNAIDNIAITDDSAWYWLRIKHKYVNWENGVVEVNASGELTGVGTAFTEILRGQGTQVPVRIKFAKEDGSSVTNSGFYEVVDITSDTVAILTSAIEFQTETDLKMVVVGTTPVGESVTVEQEGGLYSYDSCEIEIVAEVDLDTAPETGFIQDQTFYIARVQNTGGFVVVQDKRTEWWEFNVVGLTDKLSIYNNLSDLSNKDNALTNLGITTAGKAIAKINPTSSSTYIKINSNGTVQQLTREEVAGEVASTLQLVLMTRALNLADLTDKPLARANLGINSVLAINLDINPSYSVVVADGLSLRVFHKVVTLHIKVQVVGTVTSATLATIPEEYRPNVSMDVVAKSGLAPYTLAPILISTLGPIQPSSDLNVVGTSFTAVATWIID